MSINGWRVMWVLAVFDFPTTTPEARKAYTQYRKSLLKENFNQLQFSVYLRHCPTFANAEALINRLRNTIPENGHVVYFLLTDKQYGMTREHFGFQKTKKRPDSPKQIELF